MNRWLVLLAMPLLTGCLGRTCQEAYVSQIAVPPEARRGMPVSLAFTVGGDGETGFTAPIVDDANRIVMFTATTCQALDLAYYGPKPASVTPPKIYAASFTPNATGVYTIVLRGGTATATVTVTD